MFLRNQNFLICLVGLPSSGKSTFANLLKIALENRYKDLDVKIIDPDIIRNKLTPAKFDHEKEHIVRSENLKIVKSELQKRNIVISDDLNYYSSMRHDLKVIADDLNLNFFIIHIITPIDICMKWNEKRGEPIPNVVISKIQEKFDKFNKYNWDFAVATYDLSVINNITLEIEELLDQLEDKIVYEKRKKRPERKKIITNIFNESLDKITRTYVGKLLIIPDYLPLKKKIIKLRKIYVKRNKNKVQSEAAIANDFKDYLEKSLNIEISEYFN